MKLLSLRIDGFGKIADRTFAFGPGLNVVAGPNEAGKSTLAAAIVASLYGLQRGEKERRRPWGAAPFATTLVYETADGARWEVRREFEKDAKGVRVFDADGVDAAARVGAGRALVPGEAHLGISLEVFLQTACARQRGVALDGDAAGEVSSALAQALDGGPKEDAALGALARLDAALRKHVGTQRATKNAPLRKVRADEEEQRRAVEQARAALDALATLRERIAGERAERDRAAAAAAELDRRIIALRAAQLRARIAHLKDYHDDLAAVQSARAAFDDVATFPSERVGELDETFHAWRAAEELAVAAAREAESETIGASERRDLAELQRDAGTLDEERVAAVRAAAAQAGAARAKAAAAAGEAAAARREGDDGRAFAGIVVAATLLATLADVGVAIAHLWLWTAVVSAVALVLGFAAFGRAGARAARRREADAKQRIADAALADERGAADAVARVLEPLGIASVEVLLRRRERYVALAELAARAERAGARARLAREQADAAASRFDALATILVPDAGGSRAERRAAAHARAARRRERDGIENRLAMLAVQRGQILGAEDAFALESEYAALVARGVEPAAADDPRALQQAERERAELDGRVREAERLVASLEGELRAGEDNVPDVAALDEALAATRAQIARLEAFERAVVLAHATIAARKDEAHRGFARRLEEYGAGLLREVTGGRYGELRVEPSTLAIRVRVPETGAIEELDRLSAGTRDQIALVVRFATARMFAEGLERPPLLLDDPFAFWDGDRIARCLPVLVRGAAELQTVLFTASAELAAAAAAGGARSITLDAPPARDYVPV